MPRRGAIAVILTTFALVLLLNFKTPDPATLSASDPAAGRLGAARPTLPAPTTRPGTGLAGDGRGDGASAAPPASGTPPAATAQPGQANGRLTSPVVDTRYGPVQIAVTFSGGRIVDVQALQLPTDRELSARISSYVEPILRSEALQAQSANIDVISGATYTSEAYAESLQAVLDQAGG